LRGQLVIIGVGPGSADQITLQAKVALEAADVLYGYGLYLDRVPERAGQARIVSDNKQELMRAEQALAAAAGGANVAVISSGDPGVFAMAAVVCEAIERGPAAWRELELTIVPGITAMLAVAARLGAPLGHDFCAISLSDNLKPWSTIESRLRAAASAGFAMALYSPTSRARPWQLEAAFAALRGCLDGNIPVVFARGVSRSDERIVVSTLATADPSAADMATCIIIGTAETRVIGRPDAIPIVYTSRAMSGTSK
jgi:precorrin-3B C17-methyltransferase